MPIGGGSESLAAVSSGHQEKDEQEGKTQKGDFSHRARDHRAEQDPLEFVKTFGG